VIEPNESGRKAPGRTAGIIVGTLLGDLVGSNLSLSIDEADELRAAFVLDKNQNGEAAAWVNPNKGTEVTVVPILSYQTPTGEHCREYQVELSTEGKKSSVAGTACRQPDGQWKMVR
jgi:surface antigen